MRVCNRSIWRAVANTAKNDGFVKGIVLFCTGCCRSFSSMSLGLQCLMFQSAIGLLCTPSRKHQYLSKCRKLLP